MPMALDSLPLGPINVSTQRYIIRNGGKLLDGVYQADPVWRHNNANKDPFTGGRNIQFNFQFDGLTGAAYSPGEEFDIDEKQIEQALQFILSWFYVNVSLEKGTIQVINRGDAALFKLLDSRMSAAYNTIGAQQAIAFPLGQSSVSANGTKLYQGYAEAINDNSTNSWDGNTYSAYGGLTRAAPYLEAVNGHIATSNGALISYDDLLDSFLSACYGDGVWEVNMMNTTVQGWGGITKIFQTQQRYTNIRDLRTGIIGIQFMTAAILKGRYQPGATYLGASAGTQDRIAVGFINKTTGGVDVAYPSVSGETMIGLNTRSPENHRFVVTTDPEFGFGFSGFIPSQRSTKIAGQVLAATCLILFPRYHFQRTNFTA